jgi:rapamycin-insensitive companion of mTOR
MKGESLGYCMPLEFERLFQVKGWNDGRLKAVDAIVIRGDDSMGAKSDDGNQTTTRVLKCVAMLGNTVMSKRAAGELLA